MRLPYSLLAQKAKFFLDLIFFHSMKDSYLASFISVSITDDEVSVVAPQCLLHGLSEGDCCDNDGRNWSVLGVSLFEAIGEESGEKKNSCLISRITQALSLECISAYFVSCETMLYVLVGEEVEERATTVLFATLQSSPGVDIGRPVQHEGSAHVRLWKQKMTFMESPRSQLPLLSYALLMGLFSQTPGEGDVVSLTLSPATVELLAPLRSPFPLEGLGVKLEERTVTLVEYCDAVQDANEQPGIAASITRPLGSSSFSFSALSTFSTDFVFVYSTTEHADNHAEVQAIYERSFIVLEG